MRSCIVLVCLVLTSACGGSKSSKRGDSAVPPNDGSPERDGAPDVAVPDGSLPEVAVVADVAARDTSVAEADALATFCTGDLIRSMVNGIAGAPAASFSGIATGCCDGFELRLDSATFVSSIYVEAISEGVGFVPADVDLGNLPRGWRFRVKSDCGSSPSSCKESYESGFVGRLQMARADGGSTIDVNLCLHVEDTDGTHTLRTFDLYIPHGTIR